MSQSPNSSTSELYVIGAGGHAREVHAYIEDLTRCGWKGDLKGFLDDCVSPGMHGRLAVLGPISEQSVPRTPNLSRAYITAIGSNTLRRDIVERLERVYGSAFSAWTLVHPAAYIGEDVEIGEGTCVAPGAFLTSKVTIGRHCIVNVKTAVSHDCRVGDFVNLNPSSTICGWVQVGDGAFIGAGATVKDRVSIGAWSVIGAGAVVTRDIPSNVTAVGVPARVIKHSGLLSCQDLAAR